jgi:hypothetical protein
MLIEQRLHAGIRDGSITVMFRQWRRRQVTAGNTYRTAAGRIVVDEVSEIKPSRIRRADAVAAGYQSVAEAVADLRGTPEDPVFLLRLHLAEDEDPRAILADSGELSTPDVEEITRRLERLDRASTHDPWTSETLASFRNVRLSAREISRRSLVARCSPVHSGRAQGQEPGPDTEPGSRLSPSPRGEAYLRLR